MYNQCDVKQKRSPTIFFSKSNLDYQAATNEMNDQSEKASTLKVYSCNDRIKNTIVTSTLTKHPLLQKL